jgi:hypothetical protein
MNQGQQECHNKNEKQEAYTNPYEGGYVPVWMQQERFDILLEPAIQVMQEGRAVPVDSRVAVATVECGIAAPVAAAAPTTAASGGQCQQDAEDPQGSVVPQDPPGTFEDFSNVDHFISPFLINKDEISCYLDERLSH